MPKEIDPYLKFNRERVNDRQINELIGISKGLVSDGVVNQDEAEWLLDWLRINEAAVTENPVTRPLLDQIAIMLDDGFLDDEESKELLAALKAFSGDKSEPGEFLKTGSLPLNDPPPPLVFPDRLFLFTGTCVYGARKACQLAVSERKGINAKAVTLKLDYLILGEYVTSSWKHEPFGNKITKAMRYRDESGSNVAIISEKYWRKQLNVHRT